MTIPRSGSIRNGLYEIPVKNSPYPALVDIKFSFLDKSYWRLTRGGYARGRINNKDQLMHRFILGLTLDRPQVDHKDGNPLNNTSSNLRTVTSQQNNWNRSSSGWGKSSYKGVQWDAQRSIWRTYIRDREYALYLGSFNVQEEAALAYDIAAIQLFDDYARLNVL